MKFKIKIAFISILNLLHAKLSVTDIKNVVEELDQEFSNIEIRHSILNPMYGYLLESFGVLKNLRFYGPDIQMQYKDGTRQFANDKSSYYLRKAIIELFKSPSGLLTHITRAKDNFGLYFEENYSNCIQLMSELFYSILENKNECPIKEKKEITKFFFKSKNNSFNIFPDEKSIKLMVIHSFMINISKNASDLKLFLKNIISKPGFTITEIYDKNLDIINEIIQINEQIKTFPYSKVKQPPSNIVIPCCLRYSQNSDGYFTDYQDDLQIKNYNDKNFKYLNNTFSDCADITILHICNCFLFDFDSINYKTNTLEKNSDIYRFYKFFDVFDNSINDENRKNWSKVIQGLEGFPKKDQTEFKIDSIFYNDQVNLNELDTGIINMINILIKIFYLDHEKIWDGFDYEKINNILVLVFEKIAKITGADFTINIPKNFDLKETDFRKDFFGDFYLSFTLKNARIVKLKISQTQRHAEIKVVEDNISIKSNCNFSFCDSPLPTKILKNYLSLVYNLKYEDIFTDIFEKIYFKEQIETNNTKKEILTLIFDEILNSEILNIKKIDPMKIEILIKFANQILQTINLNDPGTANIFKPFFYYMNGLNDDEIFDCWINSLGIEGSQIYKLWELRILNIKKDKFKLNLTEINPEKQFYIYNILKNFDIKDLDFSESKPTLRKLRNTNEFLKNFKNLETLNLSRNELSNEDCEKFIEGLKEFKNLKNLNISYNHLYEEDAAKMIFEVLKKYNLVNFNIKGNMLKFNGCKNIIKALKQHTNLESLDISYNIIELKGLKKIAEELNHLPNFKFLNAAGSFDKMDETCENIAEVLQSFTNLETINFSDNCLSKESQEKISDILKHKTNLRIIFN